jgi:hypothetical protein
MCEPGVCMLTQVLLDLVPVVPIVSNPLAVTADRQQALQLLHPSNRFFQVPYPGSKIGLQAKHSLPDLHPGAKLVEVKRLGYVVIRPRLKTVDNVRLAAKRSKEDDVESESRPYSSDPSAQLDSAH